MLSFKVMAGLAVPLLFIGCARNDVHPTPDTMVANAGASVVGATDTAPLGGSGGSNAPTPAGTATSMVTTTSTGASPAGTSDNETLSDEQVAAVTDAANDGEIAQGKTAQGKARNARVKAFAAKMIAHHGQAKEKQSKLGITNADSALSKKLKTDGAATLASLHSTPAGPAFDEVYMKAQIDGHQKVLDTINDRLLPSVRNEKLAEYVKSIKPTVEAHLKEAREIEQSLSTKTDSSNGSNGADAKAVH